MTTLLLLEIVNTALMIGAGLIGIYILSRTKE